MRPDAAHARTIGVDLGGTKGYWQAARAAAEQHAIPEMFRGCSLAQVRSGARVAARGAIRLASH